MSVRELTHSVVVDIDSILEDHRKLSAKLAFDRLFAGWDDDNNTDYADCQMTALRLLGEEHHWEELEAAYAEMEVAYDAFTGFQGTETSAEQMPTDDKLFDALWYDTRNNLEAAAYQEAATDIHTKVYYGYGSEIRPLVEVLEFRQIDTFYELVEQYKKEMQ
jgi:hypothetical protein